MRRQSCNYGVGNAFKFRHYEILFYDMQFFGVAKLVQRRSQPSVLNPDNIYPNYPNRIYYQSGNNTPNPNEYASNSNTAHAYVSTEVALEHSHQSSHRFARRTLHPAPYRTRSNLRQWGRDEWQEFDQRCRA